MTYKQSPRGDVHKVINFRVIHGVKTGTFPIRDAFNLTIRLKRDSIYVTDRSVGD